MCHCFPGGPSDQLDLLGSFLDAGGNRSGSSFRCRCRRKTGPVLDAGGKPECLREKPTEASLDWKPSRHISAGTRDRTRDSLVQARVDTLRGGGVLELFFDGVCGPRSEILTHF